MRAIVRRRAFAAEERAVATVAMAQFLCAVDFIMVLPLGPELARGLGASIAQVGYMTASYALAAFCCGLGSAGFLDRFDRRDALGVALAGLTCASALSAMANSLATLLAARFLAGAFAGPAMALGLALVGDLVPIERRGHAVTVIVTAGSLAAIMGVPAGLTLAELGGWRSPFASIAFAGVAVVVVTRRVLPAMTAHLAQAGRETLAIRMRVVASPTGAAAIGCSILSAASGYLIVANVAGHLQVNLGFPRAGFGGLYMAGGCTAFVVTRLSGAALDRLGAWRVMLCANMLFAAVVWELFVRGAVAVPVLFLFVGSMTANALRNASLQTALMRVPPPGSRAAFLSITGSVQHLGTALGAAGGSVLLHDSAVAIRGMDKIGWLAITLTATLTPLVMLVEVLRRRTERRTPSLPPVEWRPIPTRPDDDVSPLETPRFNENPL